MSDDGAIFAAKPSRPLNAALAALQRFYGWARETGRIKANPTAKLKPIATPAIVPLRVPPR